MILPQPPRINPVERIIVDVSIEVHAVGVANWVGLEEAAEGGGVVAGAVVVQACSGVPSAGGEQVRIAHGADILRGRILGQPVAVGARGGHHTPVHTVETHGRASLPSSRIDPSASAK